MAVNHGGTPRARGRGRETGIDAEAPQVLPCLDRRNRRYRATMFCIPDGRVPSRGGGLPGLGFDLRRRAREACESHPAVREEYARCWTALRPGAGDLDFFVQGIRREARRRFGPQPIDPAVFPARIEACLCAIEEGVKELLRIEDHNADDGRFARASLERSLSRHLVFLCRSLPLMEGTGSVEQEFGRKEAKR